MTCLFANQALQLIDTTSLKAFTESLASQNYLFWLAVYAVFFRLLRSDGEMAASRLDYWAALAICLAVLCTSFLPYRFATGLLATATAGYILLPHEGDRNLKAAGIVLLAVAVQLVWAPIVFQLFTPELLHADAALVGEMLAWLLPDVIWRGTNFIAPGRAHHRPGRCLLLIQQRLQRGAGLRYGDDADASRMAAPRSGDDCDRKRRDDRCQFIADLPDRQE